MRLLKRLFGNEKTMELSISKEISTWNLDSYGELDWEIRSRVKDLLAEKIVDQMNVELDEEVKASLVKELTSREYVKGTLDRHYQDKIKDWLDTNSRY